MTHGYNGWTNYETWVVNLWLTNEQASSRYWGEQADECFVDAQQGYPITKVLTVSENARLHLADLLKDDHKGEEHPAIVAVQGTVYADLLNAALQSVNWGEIADSLLDDIDGYERA